MNSLVFQPPRRRMRWGSILFMIAVNLAAFVWLPMHTVRNGVSPQALSLFVFYVLATSFSITLGYHRLFAHASFRAHPAVRLFVLFFGAAAFEQSALKWASLHRRHHQYTDTEKDPYNIKQGFFYAHVGWILFWKHHVDYDNVKDLQKSALVTHQHKHYALWSWTAGVALPLAIGALTGDLFGAFLWAVAARIAIVFHSAFFINSFAHTFGSQEYDLTSSAKDHWLGAVLTNGEGYHNYHHKFPIDYRNGIQWHHWDPTKWAIWALEKLGLASELRRTPSQMITEARTTARP